MRILSGFQLVIYVTISVLFAFASTAKADNEALPAGVTITQLDNGMQVLLIENSGLPMVGVNVVVKVGSAYESFATSGMSHMLEHLLFNGTTSRTQKELYDDTDRIGGYNNANTSDYYTNFMMVTPAENIRSGMEIQADMLFRSTLPEEKFEKEKGIVLEEISKSLAQPGEQAERNIISLLYNGHALSLPTLGTYMTIKEMDRDQVFEFYKNHYVPNNMLMSVVGNFKTPEMLKTIQEIYGSEAPGEVYRESQAAWSVGTDRSNLVLPESDQIYHRFYEGKQLQLQLFYPISEANQSAYYDLLDVALKAKEQDLQQKLQNKFADTFQSVRLQTRATPIASFVQVRINLAAEKSIAELRDAVNAFMRATTWALSEDNARSEIAKARTSFLQNIEKPHMFGIYNAHIFAENGIEGVLASYSEASYRAALKKMADLKINGSPITLLQHPSPKNSVAAADSVQATKLFKSDARSATIIARQNQAGNLLAIHYLIGHKAPLEKQYGKDAAKMLHACFEERLNSDANKKKAADFGIVLKANDNPFIPMDDRYMHPDYGYIRIEALADKAADVVSFLNQQMLNFKPTEAEYNKVAAKMKRPNPMMMGGHDPAKKMFEQTYQSIILQDNPYPLKKELPDYQTLLQFAMDYFVPGNMTISVISPAAPAESAAWFSGFTGPDFSAPAPVYDRGIRLQQVPRTIDKAGNGSRSYLFWGFSKEIDTQDKAALEALSILLRDKIVFDIREKQGMAYHMSAGIQQHNNRALFYIKQGTRPENVDKLLPQYADFFKQSILDDITEADLQKSLNMYLGRQMFRRLSSVNQGYYLGTSYYFHNDINYDQRFLNDLKKVTLADVRRVATTYMLPQNIVQIVIR